MKKYNMSNVDFSEIVNVTADSEQLYRAEDRMKEIGLMTEKGNASPARISDTVETYLPPFFEKLTRRLIRRTGEIQNMSATFTMLAEKREYTAVFLYLAILYGFLQWRVPESFSLLAANPDTLKCFALEFTERLSEQVGTLEIGDKDETEQKES